MKVTLLIEGTHVDKEVDGFMTYGPHTGAVTLVQTPEKNILIDSGNKGYGEELTHALLQKGIDVGDIHYVLHTHLHLDHVHNDYIFTNARLVTYKIMVGDRKTWQHNDDWKHWGLEGIEMFHTPGHNPDHVSYFVEDDAGTKWVIAGDAIREEKLREGEFAAMAGMEAEYLESMKQIFARADKIIQGHGPIIEGERFQELKQMVEEWKL